MSAYFIAGTGTGIGKTFTTCALIHAARQAGIAVEAFKPVISGWDAAGGTDTTQIIAASGDAREIDHVPPWRFAAPLSPHRAAALEKKRIDLAELVEWSRARAAEPGLTLIEGAGGVMAPLDETHTTLDWMAALGAPVILVTGSYLGTISHTLTAISALGHAGLSVRALIMNESEGSMVDFTEAQAGFEALRQNIPLRIFQRRVSSARQATEIFTLLQQL